MEAISVFLLMLQSVLVALGDFKKNGLPQSDAIESVAAEAGFKDEFLKTGIFYLAVGVILVPILALRMFRGKQKLGNPSKISVSKVKKVLYRSYPEAVAASALCMSYFIAESIGCIYREDTYYKCTDVIASNSAFSILFVVGVIHKVRKRFLFAATKKRSSNSLGSLTRCRVSLNRSVSSPTTSV